MVNFKEDEALNTLNHSCAHLMAQAIRHLYPQAKFWVGQLLQRDSIMMLISVIMYLRKRTWLQSKRK